MNTYEFKIYGHEFETKVVRREEDEVVVSVNGQEYKAYLQPRISKSMAKATPKLVRPTAVPAEGTRKTAAPGEAKGAGIVKAPLPGLMLKVLVKVGDAVKSGDTVCIMEAMKMQNNIVATATGTVATVSVSEGQSILEGQEIIKISAS
jgi:glutaconyl-CoA/methylmalonyl-CoA decarboxylase subunit gamma